MRKVILLLALIGLVDAGFAAYNVRRPSDALRPTVAAADIKPGVWTLNYEAVRARARAEGRCLVLLNTGSWWCPFCETLEETVLVSAAWKQYVEGNGFYLAMLDFPYRGHVSDEEVSKSWHPELGDGWGFKCWLMDPDFLADNGMDEQAGLSAIMHEYEIQKSLAYPSAQQVTIRDYTDSYDFTYGKLGYPTFIVFGPDGEEKGRASFPWMRRGDVTDSEAQEYVLQALEMIIAGKCEICEAPQEGVPPSDRAQHYTGWLTDDSGAAVGTCEFKTGRMSRQGVIKVSGGFLVDGVKTKFPSVSVETGLDEPVPFSKDDSAVQVKFGRTGLSGTVSKGSAVYTIHGGRNVFRAKDEDAVSRLSDCPIGGWNVILKPSDGVSPSPFARGYGALSVQLKAKGKAKVSGWLGDGTKISCSAQAIVGEKRMACLPVFYDKNGERFGFVIWFRNGRLMNFDNVSKWNSTRQDTFESVIVPTSTLSPGIGVPQPQMDLEIAGLDDATIGGLPIAVDPSLDEVTVSKKAWRGTEVTWFKATQNAMTGLMSGSVRFVVERPGGSTKTVKGIFHGIVMGGSAYGSVLFRREGTWSCKISACGSCGAM